jgi:hypothetical protein
MERLRLLLDQPTGLIVRTDTGTRPDLDFRELIRLG